MNRNYGGQFGFSAQSWNIHGVLSCKENDEMVQYFDSFGVKPPSKLVNYWRRRNPDISVVYNSKQNQSIEGISE